MFDTTKSKTFVLVDANSELRRYVEPMLDRWENAVLDCINAILLLKQEYGAEKVIWCFDGKEAVAERKKVYAPYKSNRPVPDERVHKAMAYMKRLITKRGMYTLIHPKLEADDTIAQLCFTMPESDINLIVVSKDKDLWALLQQPNVTVAWPEDAMYSALNEEAARKRLGGLYLSQLQDYKTLAGDPSDNVKGVKGVGAKTAAAWLNEYGTLNNVIENKDSLKVNKTQAAGLEEALADGARELKAMAKVVAFRTDIQFDPQFVKDLKG